MNYQGGMDGQGFPGQQQHLYYPSVPPTGNDKSNPMKYPNLGDTSQNPPMYVNAPLQSFQGNVVAEAALFYGNKLIGSSKEMVDEKIKKYQSVNALRHYFSVDTSYVGNKLKLLLFPFSHPDWSRKYTESIPAKPRYDINSPDLYIPLMGYVTYLLVVGLVLGIQSRFNVEVLAVLSSQSIACILIEISIQLIILYAINVKTPLSVIELVALSGYKFVGMIISALLSIAFYKKGYYVGLIYCSASLAFYMVRTLRLHILSNYDNAVDMTSSGYPQDMGTYYQGVPPTDTYYNSYSTLMSKRQMYFLVYIAATQPIFMWWLSFNLDMNTKAVN